MSQKTFTLNDGSSVPWLAFGTGTALFGKDASDFVRVAVKNGITHLDGAQMYNNEETLGEGIKGFERSNLFIVTKLKWTSPDKSVKTLLEESLKKLGLDYVDLFLIHSPNPVNQVPGKLKQLWSEMEGVKKDGLTKSIGVSNFRTVDLEEILDGKATVPSVNQIELHPYVYKAAAPILDLCRKHGITVASYGGLTPLARVPGGPVDSVVSATQAALEKKAGFPITSGQVLTKWILQKGAFVITTTSKVERILESLDTINVPDLTENDINAIDQEGAKLHKRIYMKHVFEEENEEKKT